MWRAFVIRDVLLARHSPLLLLLLCCRLLPVSIRLLPSPPPPRPPPLAALSSFFLRFSMRGLETRLINIAGVAASLFSRVPSSQSAFTGHCTHDARMYYECRPFPPSPSLHSLCRDVCTFRVENVGYGNAIPDKIVTRDAPP